MDKYLLIHDVDTAKLTKLLSVLLEIPSVEVKTHECLVIESNRIEVLDFIRALFGGRLSDVDTVVNVLQGKAPISYRSAEPDPVVKLMEPMQEVRAQVNKEIDQVVEKVDAATFPARKVGSPQVKLKPDKASREIRSWHVLLGGTEVEVITISEKNRRLAAGEFDTDTILQHPKAGKQRITGEKGSPQGMEPI